MALDEIQSWIAFLFLIVPLLMFLLKFITQNKQNLPGPPKLPVIGNLHQLGNLPHQSLYKLSKKHGPVMFMQLGRVRTVVISSPEAAREILRAHDLACCSRPQFAAARKMSYNLKDVAFSSYGEHWRHVRKLIILELLSLKRVQSFRFVREREVELMISSISQSASSGSVVNLTKKLFFLTANITLTMSFGFNYRESEFKKKRFHEVVHEVEAVLASVSAEEYFPRIGWIFDLLTGYHRRSERVFHELDSLFEHIINAHLKPRRVEEDEDMIDVLLRIEKEQAQLGNGDHFTKDNVKAVLVNLFIAGIDTSAITLNWAMAELVRNPRAMKKAQEEIRSHIGNKRRVTEVDLDQLEYMKMVIKETLRLHPPAPLLLPRESMSGFKLYNHTIDPKTLIHVNAWAIGRDSRYWKNPEEFVPERFCDENANIDYKGQNFEFLPFGAGRRICPGIHMGVTTVEIALANLLYHFDWNLSERQGSGEELDMEETVGVSLTVSKKIDLTLVPVNYVP